MIPLWKVLLLRGVPRFESQTINLPLGDGTWICCWAWNCLVGHVFYGFDLPWDSSPCAMKKKHHSGEYVGHFFLSHRRSKIQVKCGDVFILSTIGAVLIVISLEWSCWDDRFFTNPKWRAVRGRNKVVGVGGVVRSNQIKIFLPWKIHSFFWLGICFFMFCFFPNKKSGVANQVLGTNWWRKKPGNWHFAGFEHRSFNVIEFLEKLWHGAVRWWLKIRRSPPWDVKNPCKNGRKLPTSTGEFPDFWTNKQTVSPCLSERWGFFYKEGEVSHTRQVDEKRGMFPFPFPDLGTIQKGEWILPIGMGVSLFFCWTRFFQVKGRDVVLFWNFSQLFESIGIVVVF